MNCLQCGRRVKDTTDAKFKHLQRYHFDILFRRLFTAMTDQQFLFELGRKFGFYVQNEIQSRLR